MNFKQKIVHKKLIEVIGDPAAPEHTWLAACEALDQSTSKKQLPTVVNHPSAIVLKRVLAVISIASYSVFSIALFSAAASSLANIIGGVDEDWSAENLPDIIGFIVALFGSIGFWQRFYDQKSSKLRELSWLSLLCVGTTIALFLVDSEKSLFKGLLEDLLVILLIASAIVPVFWIGSKFASFVRNALSQTFHAETTLYVTGLSAAPFAVYFLACFLLPDNLSEFIDQTDNLKWILLIAVCALPSYVSARILRTTITAKALILSAILNAPLLVGVFVIALLALFIETDSPHAVATAILSSSTLLVLIIFAISLVLGAILGVKHNQHIAAKNLD